MAKGKEKEADIKLGDGEFSVLSDTHFLLTKRAITAKARKLLSLTYLSLSEEIRKMPADLPEGASLKNAKVSRGENYRGLPYFVLDCPKLLTTTSIFSLRTMLWWGHEFSTTLHLQGEALDQYRERLIQSSSSQLFSKFYICVNDTPWEYHFGTDNYVSCSRMQGKLKEFIHRATFIKLATRWDLQEWDRTPDHVVHTWRTLRELVID